MRTSLRIIKLEQRIDNKIFITGKKFSEKIANLEYVTYLLIKEKKVY